MYKLDDFGFKRFETSNVTDMGYMFSECIRLTTLDLSSFETSNVTSMMYMFSRCSELMTLNLSSFETSKVTSMMFMFYGCSELTTLDLSSFETSNVTDMGYMFGGCSGLTDLDLSNFDTGNVTYMNAMVWYCDSLESIKTPYHCTVSATLPLIDEGAIWRDADGNVYQELPQGLDYSIKLTREAGSVSDKTTVEISGIEVKSGVYSKSEMPVTGTAVVDADGTDVTDQVTLIYTYEGTLADGSIYGETQQAPVDAGSYTLTVAVAQANREYEGSRAYPFTIEQAPLTIAARVMGLAIGAELPNPEDYQYDVTGLCGEDRLITEPKITCDIKDTASVGVYDIVISDADAGMNYRIEYRNSTLTVSESGEAVVYYTVIFDMDGHDNNIVMTKIKKDSLIEKPADPAAEGYIFGGWYKEAGCTNAWDFNADTITQDTTIYAKWTKQTSGGDDNKPAPTTFTVTYNMQNHGTQIASVSVNSGDKLTAPASPAAEGYTFEGWYKEAGCINA